MDELPHKVSTSCLRICRRVVSKNKSTNCSVDELSFYSRIVVRTTAYLKAIMEVYGKQLQVLALECNTVLEDPAAVSIVSLKMAASITNLTK